MHIVFITTAWPYVQLTMQIMGYWCVVSNTVHITVLCMIIIITQWYKNHGCWTNVLETHNSMQYMDATLLFTLTLKVNEQEDMIPCTLVCVWHFFFFTQRVRFKYSNVSSDILNFGLLRWWFCNNVECVLFTAFHSNYGSKQIYPSHKSYNELDKYSTIHHFVT